MKRLFWIGLLIPLFFVYTSSAHAQDLDERSVEQEIIYDILVDRYNKGEQSSNENVDADDPYAFHGGDLEGITKKLDDIEELGFTAITISPIMKNSPDGYHGYWVEDFFEIDEHFGTKEELDHLIEEAHDRGIKVIVEMVTNYVGLSNDIATDDDKTDWLDGKANDEDIPWMDDVDELNQTNDEVEELLYDAADYWMEETDIDGYKLHAADEADSGFLHDLTAHIKEQDNDFLLIADVLYPDNGTDELENDEAIDLVPDASFYESMTDIFSEMDEPVEDMFEDWEEEPSAKNLLYVDNKYTKRFTQAFAEKGRNPVTVWKMALTFMYATPGTPYIYQGSEVPMYGDGFPETQAMVPFTSEDEDLEEFYHRLGSLHDEFPALSEGDFQLVDSSEAMSVFERSTEDEKVFVAVNNDSEAQGLSVDDVESGNQLRGLLEDDIVREEDDGSYTISLPRETADIYVIEPDTGLNWPFIILIGGIFLLFPAFIITVSIRQKRQQKS